MMSNRLCLALVAVVWFGLNDTALAETPGELSTRSSLQWTALLALVLAATHLFSPTVRTLFAGEQRILGSLGGGMAIAFIFLHLMPELDERHKVLGEIYLVVLVGFLFFYASEYLLHRRNKHSGETTNKAKFGLHLIFAWMYTWLLVYAMPAQITQVRLHVIPVVLALSLHLLQQDQSLASEHPKDFRTWGRYVLATAPIVGWLADLVISTNNMTSNILTGILAGWTLYNVLKIQLPEHQESDVRWFLKGAIVFVALHLVADFV